MKPRERRADRGEAMVLALEQAEELVAVATLMEEHVRDTFDLDKRTVGAVARQLRRAGKQIVRQLAEAIEGR